MIKTGMGIDAHALTDGDGLILGGVKIPYGKSIEGHSDGDAAIHAVVDALLGTLCAGDIGTHFPSNDERWRNADSRLFLQHVAKMLVEASAEVNHIDCTIVLQEPRLADHVAAMRLNVAHDLGIALDRISIKATTTDYLGFTGRKEGIVAVAIATVKTT